MSKWYNDARFVMYGTEYEVFVENSEAENTYLFVENDQLDFDNAYCCNQYHLVENLSGNIEYIRYDGTGAMNEYLTELEKAPWDIARDIICVELNRWANILEGIEENCIVEDYPTSDMFRDFVNFLKEYVTADATPDEKFEYC